jgi:hypothetical protein
VHRAMGSRSGLFAVAIPARRAIDRNLVRAPVVVSIPTNGFHERAFCGLASVRSRSTTAAALAMEHAEQLGLAAWVRARDDLVATSECRVRPVGKKTPRPGLAGCCRRSGDQAHELSRRPRPG